jgi:hypothetical protein
LPHKILILVFALAIGSVNAQLTDSISTSDSTTNLAGKTFKFSADTVIQYTTITKNQESDTLSKAEKKKKNHSVGKAALMSALLPGLGQAYNKKYWKIPIVYAGFGGLGYAVYFTATNFTQARNAYRKQVDEDENTIGVFEGTTDPATLKEYRDFHKRNLTISGICTGVWYFLNIIDATVDAHLFNFNVSDKLSINWEPEVIRPAFGNTAFSGGAKITLHFK